MTLGRMHHLGLALSDLKTAEETFYRPVLGFLGYRKIEEENGMTLWFSETALAAVNLWQSPPELAGERHRDYTPGLQHFAFEADSREEVDALFRLLEVMGATVLDPPAEYDYSPGYYALFFADPDGIKFELVHMPPPTGT